MDEQIDLKQIELLEKEVAVENKEEAAETGINYHLDIPKNKE